MSKSTKPSQVDELAHLATEEGLDLYHDSANRGYASFMAAGHRESYRLRSTTFGLWLRHLYYQHCGEPIRTQSLQDALGVLESRTLFRGPLIQPAVRVAEYEGAIYLDLADAEWRAVEIKPEGWQVVAQPPVRFLRPPGLLPLPEPVSGGTLEDLRPFAHVTDADWHLVLAWLAAALRPQGPYPVLVLNGERGTGKSTLTRVLCSLIDPSVSPVRAAPMGKRDLAIQASNGWVLAIDHLSSLSPSLSDALCRLSTGGGFITRTLYSEGEEIIFDEQRPVILNGIKQMVTRPDLLDRALLVTLRPFSGRDRKTEEQLWRELEVARPKIMGALLDAVARGLRSLPQVTLATLPRMADFARWAVACEPEAEGSNFLAAYDRNRTDANELALDASPLPALLRMLLAKHGGEWAGTPSSLLDELTTLVSDQTARSKDWPKRPNTLSGRLRRLAPNLRNVGVEVQLGHDGTSRWISLTGPVAKDAVDAEGRPLPRKRTLPNHR
jgi:hypothetical protein